MFQTSGGGKTIVHEASLCMQPADPSLRCITPEETRPCVCVFSDRPGRGPVPEGGREGRCRPGVGALSPSPSSFRCSHAHVFMMNCALCGRADAAGKGEVRRTQPRWMEKLLLILRAPGENSAELLR